MRITNNIFQRNALAALQVNARGLATAQKQVTSGMRFERASEDPNAADAVMGSQSSLRGIEQYRRNVVFARSQAETEDGALQGLTQVMDRARELALSQATATAGSGTRAAALAEVEEIYKQVVSIANTQLGGRYIFGGVDAGSPPLDSTGALSANVDPAGTVQPSVQVNANMQMRASHNAREVFVDSGALQALADLRTALAGNDQEAIAATLDPLAEASRQVQNLHGELGAWADQMDITTANLGALEMNLKTFKADLQEVDFEEAVMDLINRQNTYQSAMMATSRVMGLTLTDYLR